MVTYLWYLKWHKKNNYNNCKAYPPIDWKVSNDTIVKPDLLIVCDKINKKYLDFTPVLVLEILSAATASKDMGEKMELYASQKVKYYLIVDPQFKKIEIHQYTNQQYVLVSENTDNFTFVLENNCTSEISLLDIWE